MPKRKFFIALDSAEFSALNEWAERERRDLRAQAAYIIHIALLQYGLLKEETATSTRTVHLTTQPRAPQADAGAA